MATTNGHVNGTDVATPKITLYTNHRCPYAQRAHITLDELKLPYEEVIIDLDTPRPQWYLDINPRKSWLVLTITEFWNLADAY